MSTQALQLTTRADGQLGQRPHAALFDALHVPVHHGLKEQLFAMKMVKQTAFTHARAFGDGVEGKMRGPVRENHGLGGVEDRLARAGTADRRR